MNRYRGWPRVSVEAEDRTQYSLCIPLLEYASVGGGLGMTLREEKAPSGVLEVQGPIYYREEMTRCEWIS